ncbi:HEXXH motif-containing putative peptide modification protein [Streptomyces sp. TRM 70351]|uniref:aKG-HExxH-type peptide beta-hydroxylase n=1 Tax=Streptomyces sp. TRM 70351 TaxID=3116552 RepID=UPI002E7C4DEA|nr:HEXXH motif-containing putative peptide modification protein [Streptomyces sp. TRM 70351]MEE1927618.1 HEXXH motif-containing putative peptide modification protein [Streptomyces sp. TRM 70351]
MDTSAARAATRIPAPALARLATTRPVPADLALLRRGLEDRRLVLLKALLTRVERRPGAVPGTARRTFETHWALLARAERDDPPAARAALAYPVVGARLAAALGAPDGPPLAEALDAFGAVAAAVALRTGTRFEAGLPAPGGVLHLPGIGALDTGADRLHLTAGARTARAGPSARRTRTVLWRLPEAARTGGPPGAGWAGTVPGWRPLRRLPGTGARLEDLDPYRVPPGGVGRAAGPPRAAAGRTGGPLRPWAPRWRAALALLRGADPRRAAEVAALLGAVVPLDGGTGPAGDAPQVSATVRAAPCAVLTTWPHSAADLAAVLVHELHHTKLEVVHDLAPLHRAATDAVHTVAWRADPRPLGGVLQGTYAHLALVDLWQRLARRPGASAGFRGAAGARRDAYWEQVAAALPILRDCGELTDAGRQFTIGMEEYHRRLGRTARPAG